MSGFHNHFARFVKEDVTVIQLSNMALTPVEQISWDLAKIAMGEELEPLAEVKPIPLSTEQMANVAGTYQEAKHEPDQTTGSEANSDQDASPGGKVGHLPPQITLINGAYAEREVVNGKGSVKQYFQP